MPDTPLTDGFRLRGTNATNSHYNVCDLMMAGGLRSARPAFVGELVESRPHFRELGAKLGDLFGGGRERCWPWTGGLE